MKKNLQFLLLVAFSFSPFFLAAQWSNVCTNNIEYLGGNVGINSGCPDSKFSINSAGNSLYTGYIFSDATAHNSRGLVVDLFPGTAPASGSQLTSISGRMTSGSGWAFGVSGSATTANPSSSGRAYGVYGVASNATSNFNYAVFGLLGGSNAGAGVVGLDNINFQLGSVWNGSTSEVPSLNSNFTNHWAGYFVGDVEVTNRMGIGCNDFSYTSSTSEPYRFFVNGGVLCNELSILATGWCDYVFDQDYDLSPLEDVEKFIAQNGHLPKTPSAKEIEETGGIEIGATTLNQQEKIEEIYLHLIRMNKEIKALKNENDMLRKQVEAGAK